MKDEWKREEQRRYYLRHRAEILAQKARYRDENRDDINRRQNERYRRRAMKEWNESTEEVG